MVDVIEVSARDGLQTESATVSTEDKLRLIAAAVAAGARRVEVCSFVNPARVPQMADAEAVVAALPKSDGVVYSGLVLNERGFHRAAETGLTEVNIVVPLSDTFSLKNQGCTVEEGLARLEAICAAAVGEGVREAVPGRAIRLAATLACTFGCPYEGEVPVKRVAEAAGRAMTAGVDEIALADTIGVAVPTDVTTRVTAVREAAAREGRAGVALRAHLHNTRNTGLANAVAAVEAGVTALDASLGGIGGCPFAPNATGNIPTEDLVYMLHRMGIYTGLDLEQLLAAVPLVEKLVGGRVPGLVSRAGVFPGSPVV